MSVATITTEPITIDPAAFYTTDLASITLGLSPAALARARKSGQLRSTRRGGRLMFQGAWLLDWLTAETPDPADAPATA